MSMADVAALSPITDRRAHVEALDVALVLHERSLRVRGDQRALEQDLCKPVLRTSQVSIWGALKKIGYTGSIPGYGKLLRNFPAAQQKAA
jgi:maleate cis-trans isomerase